MIRGPVAGFRVILPNSEDAIWRFGAMADAPPGHKGACDSRVGQMHRDPIVQDTASAAYSPSDSGRAFPESGLGRSPRP
jgi:hypothetical protein